MQTTPTLTLSALTSQWSLLSLSSWSLRVRESLRLANYWYRLVSARLPGLSLTLRHGLDEVLSTVTSITLFVVSVGETEV